ncbi:MAG: helix-turn-helix domain-containing protein [Rhodanobacter sp.]
MHQVAVIALDGVDPLGVAIPCYMFSHVRSAAGEPAYNVTVCGEAQEIQSAYFVIRTHATLAQVAHADTVLLPGIDDITFPISQPVIEVVQAAARRGARIASICSGAFVLAAAGLLDGLRATTHWAAAAELAQRYPAIDVDPRALFVDSGQIITSAGSTAGIDMCLDLIRQDFGQAVAANAARFAVTALHREGGQALFAPCERPHSTTALAPLLDWIAANANQPLTLQDIAKQAGTSIRTLNRRFKEQTGVTPTQWLLSQRTRHAQSLLEVTDLSIEAVATASGFNSAARLRERFREDFGSTPQHYRRSFAG